MDLRLLLSGSNAIRQDLLGERTSPLVLRKVTRCELCHYVAADSVSFDLQPHLKGALLEIRPLTSADWDDLFAVASDSLIWEQHPENDRYKENVFRKFFQEGLSCGGAFAILDRETHRIIGSTRYYGYDPEKSEIEIGWTFLARKHWGGIYNRELKELMLKHAFKFVENVVFYVGQDNIRSQRALEKIGAIKQGVVQRPDSRGQLSPTVKYLMRREPPGPSKLSRDLT